MEHIENEKSCFYFSGATDSRGNTAELTPGLFDWIYDATKDSMLVEEMGHAWSQYLGSDIREDLKNILIEQDTPRDPSLLVALQLILATFIECVAGEDVTCITYDSDGVHAACIFSGALSMRQYLEYMRLDGSVIRFVHDGVTAASQVKISGAKRQAGGRSSGRCGAEFTNCQTQKLIAAAQFKPPRISIVSSAGTAVERDCPDVSKLRAVLSDSKREGDRLRAAVKSTSERASRFVVFGYTPRFDIQSETSGRTVGRLLCPMELIMPFALLV